MIYFVLHESAAKDFGNCRYFYTDLHDNIIDYMRGKQKIQLVIACDYIFRIIDGKPFYLKNRTGEQNHFTDEDLVALRLKAQKL